MRGNDSKGKSLNKRIKWRFPACEGSDRRTEISDHQPSFGGRTNWKHALHYGLKWPLSSIHHPESYLFIYTTVRPFILILIFEKWPLCSKSKLGHHFLGDISVPIDPNSMADLNLRSIKASEALKRAKDSYEAPVSKRGKQTIEVLEEEVELARAKTDDNTISEEVDWLVDPGTPSTRQT